MILKHSDSHSLSIIPETDEEEKQIKKFRDELHVKGVPYAPSRADVIDDPKARVELHVWLDLDDELNRCWE